MELENIVQSKAAQAHVFLFIDPNSEILLMSTQPGVTSDNRKVQNTRKKNWGWWCKAIEQKEKGVAG